MPEVDQEFVLEHPPVVEAVLGIQFLPLAKWSLPHFGLFWQVVRSEYSRFEVQEPIIAQESVDAGTLFGARLWLIDESDAHVLQVQNDRIVLNWRRRGGSSYPRYHAMRPQIESLWQRLLHFLDQEELGTPQVIRCEFAYVNHIDVADLMSGGQSFAELFPYWQGGATDFLKEGATLAFSNTIALPDNAGQITVAFQPTVSVELKKPVMQLSFSTLTIPPTSDSTAVLAALDLARTWDLRAFKEFTSAGAQEKWGRQGSR